MLFSFLTSAFTTLIVVVASSVVPAPQEPVTVTSSDCDSVLNVNGLTVTRSSKPTDSVIMAKSSLVNVVSEITQPGPVIDLTPKTVTQCLQVAVTPSGDV